ncbi:hypothetical protein H5410_032258 [Solanum commersonii]|uniref:Uncharacterized protein n=1 Tax=Solanum commersonii TaxID=4109 RepID=A0A9J5YMF5_SOLCO|nr:hypothetical protein H5410_032258 [Solanum commersonii]
MREFLLLCEHLDTYPKQNSNLKENIILNKVAGDVPLAPSAKNISTVSKDMPNPKSKDEGKSLEIEASSSKKGKSSYSVISEKIMSRKPESKTNQVPSGTKVFSSFQVGKQNPKEEEYLKFTKDIYNLPSENRVYSKPDLKELSELPTQLVNSVKNYAQGEGVYCRFFSISMEAKDFQLYFPTINFITMEKLNSFNVKATGVDKKLPHLNKKWIKTRRNLGIKALYFILKRFCEENFMVIDHTSTWMLMTKGKNKSEILREKLLDFELHRLEATEETWKMACKFLKHKHTPDEEMM